jgi:hypothetical protein
MSSAGELVAVRHVAPRADKRVAPCSRARVAATVLVERCEIGGLTSVR